MKVIRSVAEWRSARTEPPAGSVDVGVGADFTLYRGRQHGNASPVLMVVAAGYPHSAGATIPTRGRPTPGTESISARDDRCSTSRKLEVDRS